MKYRTLGRTGFEVSELSFGAWAIGGQRRGNEVAPIDDAGSVEAITTALEMGCNFFDTADIYGYGHSEEILGRGLRQAGRLNEVYIATKGGGNFSSGETVVDFSSQHITEAVEASLMRLRRDYIDLYQLQNPSRQIISDGRIFELLDDLKAAGKIRHYGVSVSSVSEGMVCIKSGKPDTIQIVYNFFSLLQSENPSDQFFGLAHENNIGLIASEPLANGFLTGKQKLDTQYPPGDIRGSWPSHFRSHKIRLAETLRFLEQPGRNLTQAAIRFVLDEPTISTVVVGVKTAQQARENLMVSDIAPFSESEQATIKKTLFG